MQTFLYRRGDGNEGNTARFIVDLKPADCPYTALRALLCNDFIAGSKTRRYIARSVEIDGESEFGISATVYEGKNGETAFGAAWLTAELEPLKPEDLEYMISDGRSRFALREVLDNAALRQYRAERRGKR